MASRVWAQLVVGKLITYKVAKGKQSVDTVGSKQSVDTIGCRKADNIQSC